MSTNDTVTAAGQRRQRGHARTRPSSPRRSPSVCADLARQLLADAEGAEPRHRRSRSSTPPPRTTPSRSAASVARNNLFKTAIFGNDPNWGRVLARVGTTRRGLRPRRRRRVLQRRHGVPRAARLGEDRALVDLEPPRGHRRPSTSRPATRAATDPDQRPHARLRPRELGVLLMSDRRHPTAAPTTSRPTPRPRTLIEALPWLKQYARQDRRREVRRQRDDRRRRSSRPSPRTSSFLRCARRQPRRRARRRPADLADAQPARHRQSEFQGGFRVTTPEAMDVVRMVLVGQVGRELVGLINAHGPLAVGMSGEDAGLFTADADGTVVDGDEVDLGLVGDVVEVNPQPVLDLIAAGRIPVVSTRRARRATAWCTTSTPTPPPPRWRSRSAPRSWSCSPTSRASTPTGRTRRARRARSRPPSCADAAAEPRVGHGPEDGGLPARRRRRRPAGDRHRRPRAARGAARDLHRRGRRHEVLPDGTTSAHARRSRSTVMTLAGALRGAA